MRSPFYFAALTCVLKAVSSASCGGIVGLLATDVSGLPVAQSWCTSKFPIPPVTSTVTAPTSTATSIATSTSTKFSTITSTTEATTVIPSISTITSTVSTITVTTTTSTVTTTITSYTPTATPAKLLKRASSISNTSTSKSVSTTQLTATTQSSTAKTTTTTSAPSSCTGSRQQCAFSSLVATGSALAGSICSCIEATKTSTVTTTPTTTLTVTTVTGIVQPTTIVTTTVSTSISTIFTTITSTITSTSTSTSTTTSTTTTFLPQPTCGPNSAHLPNSQCYPSDIGLCCDSSCNPTCYPPIQYCYTACDQNDCFTHNSASFDATNNECTVYGDCPACPSSKLKMFARDFGTSKVTDKRQSAGDKFTRTSGSRIIQLAKGNAVDFKVVG